MVLTAVKKKGDALRYANPRLQDDWGVVLSAVQQDGFALTHANYLTSTASQGQTLRTGVTIDCARVDPQGKRGLSDGDWWIIIAA